MYLQDFQINDNCEKGMNQLLEDIREDNNSITWDDIHDAFDIVGKDDYVYSRHLNSAHKYNRPSTAQELLDYACACDCLIEFNGEYVAIDWTSNDLEIDNKLNKHKFLKPVYDELMISKTLVVWVRKCSKVKTKEDFLNAKYNTYKSIKNKLKKMVDEQKTHGKLYLTINTD